MAQHLRKYSASSLDAAFRQMRSELGERAIVVNTSERREGGIRGFLGKRVVELTASVEAADAPSTPRKPTPLERKYLSHAQPRSAAAVAAPVGSDAAVNETVEFFRQLVSDAQSRMAQPNAKVAELTVPFRRAAAPPPATTVDAGLQGEIASIREMVQVLMAEHPHAGIPEAFAEHYRRLVELGVTRRHAARLVSETIQGVDARSLRDVQVFKERLKLQIRRDVQVNGGIALHAGKRRVVALVGATGVGKTTNLAKLAAHFAIRERANVALITADTYRVAAPDQLRVYANIIGLPVHVVNDGDEYRQALQQVGGHDLVLVDTAGGSPYNTAQIDELLTVFQAAPPDEVILVVAANAQLEEQEVVLRNFARLGPTSLFISKVDETRRYGALFSLAADSRLPLCYFSTGQSVPDDMALAHAGMVANWIVEGEDRRGRSSA